MATCLIILFHKIQGGFCVPCFQTWAWSCVAKKNMKCVSSFVPAEALAQDLMTLIAVISLALGGEAQMLFGHGHTQ